MTSNPAKEMAERVGDIVSDAAMYAAEDVTIGHWPAPCPDCGPADDPEAERCRGCGQPLADPTDVDTARWYVAIKFRGRTFTHDGVGIAGAVDSASLAVEDLRRAWRVMARDMLRRQIAAARKAPVECHVRMKSRYPLPPEVAVEPHAVEVLPGGMKGYVFTVSQARTIMRSLR